MSVDELELKLHTAKTNILLEMSRENWQPSNIRLLVKRLSRPVQIDIKRFSPEEQKDINKLLHIVCRISNITKSSLLSKTRKREVIYARQLCMFIMTTEFNLKLAKTGLLFGLDHATVIHSRDKIKDWVDIGDKQTIEDLKLIRELL